jgi:hypothetical protein
VDRRLTASVRALGVAATTLTAFSTVASAQSRQNLSAQVSGSMLFATGKDAEFDPGTPLGYEAQLRYTFSRFSLGAGYERSQSFPFPGSNLRLELSFGFVEPRIVLAVGSRVAGYAAARIGMGKLVCTGNCPILSLKATYGMGGGLLIRLNRRVSADAGGQLFRVSGEFPRGFVMARTGLSIGF